MNHFLKITLQNGEVYYYDRVLGTVDGKKVRMRVPIVRDIHFDLGKKFSVIFETGMFLVDDIVVDVQPIIDINVAWFITGTEDDGSKYRVNFAKKCVYGTKLLEMYPTECTQEGLPFASCSELKVGEPFVADLPAIDKILKTRSVQNIICAY